MSNLISKLNNMLSAMALADAGDLDGVRDILRKKEKGSIGAPTSAAPAAEYEIAPGEAVKTGFAR